MTVTIQVGLRGGSSTRGGSAQVLLETAQAGGVGIFPGRVGLNRIAVFDEGADCILDCECVVTATLPAAIRLGRGKRRDRGAERWAFVRLQALQRAIQDRRKNLAHQVAASDATGERD